MGTDKPHRFKRWVARLILALLWFVSAFFAVAIWSSILMVGSVWGFSWDGPGWALLIAALVSTTVAVGTAVFVYRKVDRNWP